MTKKTVVKIDVLKNVLDDLQTLQGDMGKSSGAMAHMGDITSVGPGIGPLLDGAGESVTKYVDARTNAIRKVLGDSSQGLSTVIMLLQSTITNYETNENAHRAAADSTDTGGSGGSGGSGNNPAAPGGKG